MLQWLYKNFLDLSSAFGKERDENAPFWYETISNNE